MILPPSEDNVKNRQYLTILFIFFSKVIFSQEVSITSVPNKAELWIHKNPNDKGKKIGTTPYKGELNDLFSLVGDDSTTFFTLELKGYVARQFILVNDDKDTDMDLTINLSPKPEVETIKKHDLLMSSLFKAQKLIRTRNYNDALTLLDNLYEEYPDFSVISELRGYAFYMNRDMEKALSMFRLAFSQNTKNVDAYKMKVYLEKKLNIDAEGN